jgi:hypothetical protein
MQMAIHGTVHVHTMMFSTRAGAIGLQHMMRVTSYGTAGQRAQAYLVAARRTMSYTRLALPGVSEVAQAQGAELQDAFLTDRCLS